MGVFDDIEIGENGYITDNSWIEWVHFLIPNKPEWFRNLMRNFQAIFGHCLKCTVLDGCYLLKKTGQNSHFMKIVIAEKKEF